MNDGHQLSLARVTSEGEVQQATLPYRLGVEDAAFGRFFPGTGLVIDQHRLGLRLSPTSAEPVLPPPPGTKQWVKVLPGGRGAVGWNRSEVLLYDGTSWSGWQVPPGVEPFSVAWHDGWWVGGTRGRSPVLFDVTRNREETLPWGKRRRAMFHVGDGASVNVREVHAGLAVSQDDGLLERSVTHVYLRVGQSDWQRVYVGDDGPSQVDDPDGALPPVMLISGRQVVPASGRRARLLPAPAIGVELLRSSGQRDMYWQWAGVIEGRVTALASLWPSGERVLLHAPLGQALTPIKRWSKGTNRPVSATTAETEGFRWG